MANNKKPGSSQRGFAAMDPEKQREIASTGGRVAHEKGAAHEFTSQEAREAGRKGGEASSRERGIETADRSGTSTLTNEANGKSGESREMGTNVSRSSDKNGTRGGTAEQHTKSDRRSQKNDH